MIEGDNASAAPLAEEEGPRALSWGELAVVAILAAAATPVTGDWVMRAACDSLPRAAPLAGMLPGVGYGVALWCQF